MFVCDCIYWRPSAINYTILYDVSATSMYSDISNVKNEGMLFGPPVSMFG